MTLMRTAKSKSSSSQGKAQKPAARPQATPPASRTYGLPGTEAERKARRHRLMDEHRDTLRRLGE
jgi:hypothetical protein